MISVLCPTRGRPQNMRRMVDSGRETSAGNVEWIFYIDDDDLVSRQMSETLHAERGDVAHVVGPRILLSQMWNECYDVANPNSGIFQQTCDETVYRSHGWDFAVEEAFEDWPDRIGLVYGRDGIHDQNLATHGFITRQWVNAVGYFVPPYFSSDYNDLWLHEVAQGINRLRFLPEVFTEHMHPAVGKGPLDLTHQERLARHGQDGVDRIWLDTAPKRADDVRKLLDAIEDAA